MVRFLARLPAIALLAATISTGLIASTVKIGAYASLTGKEATWGQSFAKGTRLAIEEINSAGGVLGQPLELLLEDNQSKAGESATVVRKLISRDKVTAILGEISSGRSLEGAPLCQSAGVPMISCGSNPKVTQVGPWIFRAHFIDPFQGTVMARFARDHFHASRFALLVEVTNAYATGLGRYFGENAVAHGGTVVIEQKYSGGERDFKAQLTAIKAAGADVLFVPGYYTEVGLIVAQARQLGLTLPILGGDGWEAPQLAEIAGASLQNTFFCDNFSVEADYGATKQFISLFHRKFNEDPDGIAADAYDAVLMLTDAIKRAGSTDKNKIRSCLATINRLPGVGGLMTVDSNRDQLKAAYIHGYRDGAYHLVETIEP